MGRLPGRRQDLRVGLLTASEPALAGETASPAFQRVGGALVIRHQVSLALAAGCRRIVIVARDFAAEFAGLQRDAETAGASFHVVSAARGLSGLVTAADEVLVIAEGLLPTPGDALPLIAAGMGALVLPADVGTAAGFERIDLTHAWAGVMLVQGRMVDRLMDLAADVDPVSALLRIALQGGIPLRNVHDVVNSSGHWLLIRSEADAHAAEERWMARHTAEGPGTPGPAIARFLVRRFGAAMLHEGSSCAIGLGLAGLLGVLGVAAGWFGHLAVAFGLAACTQVLSSTSLLLLGLQHGALRQGPRRDWLAGGMGLGFDALLLALLVCAAPLLPGQTMVERAFPAFVLLGLLRALPPALPGAAVPWLEDRLVLACLLMVVAAGGVVGPVVLGLSVFLLVLGALLAGRRGATGNGIITGA